jgi:hypothetical protein
MKIRYKKKRLNSNLFIGIVWGIFGLLSLTYDGPIRWMDFGYVFMAILYLGQYVYEYNNQYLTISNGTIRKNKLFGKKIELNKITWIKKFAGDYILNTENQELTINTQVVDEKSLPELERILSEINLAPEKTPFANNA